MREMPITPAGLAALKKELVHLQREVMPAIVDEIEVAREKGDLSENAEYHAAKDKQGQVHAKIRYLKDRVGRAVVIDPTKLSGDRVVFGAIVTLFDVETESETVYQIVGQEEADFKRGRISVHSPIAQGILGREEGDEVRVKTPKGVREFEISEVRFPTEA